MDADAFLAAVRSGDVSAVEEALRVDPELARHRDAAGVSVVCLAVYGGHEDVARVLCRHRADGDDLDVFEASAAGEASRVDALLRERPELIDAISPDGFHPLGYACFFGRREVFELLLARGADLEAPAQNAMQVRPLHSAVAQRDADTALFLAERLLEAGASPNVVQQRGFTPLHEAALRGHIELVHLLLRHGAEPNARKADGQTPADLARRNGHSDIDRLLR